MDGTMTNSWTIEDSKKLYRIQDWGTPYFSINDKGNIVVFPQGDSQVSLDLFDLVKSLEKRNIKPPLIIRFPEILSDRINRLNKCFETAIKRYGYQGTYQGVYPIKCNPHRHLVENVVQFGQPYNFGLEVGSKPELMIALAVLDNPKTYQKEDSKPLLICNGYKDQEYIETALLAQCLGKQSVIVIEQLSELSLALEISKRLEIFPVLGIRAKLNTKGCGHWENSTGERAKFGLTIPQIMEAINLLKKENRLSCLQLLHFHIGSQISSITTIKDAIREATQIYIQLVKLGASMGYLDVGGGLGVDYDGSKTNSPASKNYNMQNYANDIVAEVKEVCEGENIAMPVLISESGRSIASHQSILIFDVLSTSNCATINLKSPCQDDQLIVHDIWEIYQSISIDNYQESYHDAIQFKEEAISLFNLGHLSLLERAKIENIYWACCSNILEIIQHQNEIPEDLEDLEKSLSSVYHINLSIFQSAPDTWAIKQLFPILPIHRLNEKPTKKAILADLTCDSDGKIDHFIDFRKVKNFLELHSLETNDPDSTFSNSHSLNSLAKLPKYYIGMFLVGAYQEVMGNLHNLFGDTNLVHIIMTSNSYHIEQFIKGDTMIEVLQSLDYNAHELLEQIRLCSEKALQDKKITFAQLQLLRQNYEQSLSGYTYHAVD
ncbi:biosynthetic arginine decarboxylase [Crocosphaera sp. XPORK-15E]|uniref:biosynthetic arginine decarboxylase n=1 Tax=Crocosphaera sp. XPORK-15E TaxID=3110247 RepID=UPI002B1F5369|nr:biosynthetic arginine decarboxylase [Crocosphaera sp. XPORK-15E]MEA5536726.1 biosynthetic arginine decarboxylase [Crocosphaera sp. XPORK-15E]